MTDSTRVDFWFDPSCPWAWMTSRWVDEVAAHRDLEVSWHIMSLAILNENNDVPESYRAFFPRALRYAQLVTAAQELHGDQANVRAWVRVLRQPQLQEPKRSENGAITVRYRMGE